MRRTHFLPRAVAAGGILDSGSVGRSRAVRRPCERAGGDRELAGVRRLTPTALLGTATRTGYGQVAATCLSSVTFRWRSVASFAVLAEPLFPSILADSAAPALFPVTVTLCP